jgi:2-isopropylmalate synthase
VSDAGAVRQIEGSGNGPIDAFCAAVRAGHLAELALLSYHEHALERGSGSRAVAYIQVDVFGTGALFGVGIDTDIAAASFRAILCAINRARGRSGDDLGQTPSFSPRSLTPYRKGASSP